MQGGQSISRNRGIGRYCRSLVHAMARDSRGHDVCLVLNGNFEEAAEALRDEFADVLPPSALRTWRGPGEHAANRAENDDRRRAAEHIRFAALTEADGDLLLLSSLFEGWTDASVTAFPPGTALPPYAAICYDLIPLMRPKSYLFTPRAEQWYFRRLLHMRHAAGLLAISESSRDEAIGQLGMPPDLVSNILAGVGPRFRPAEPGDEPPDRVAARYGLQPGFILCIGAVEPRKNLEGLIRAYGRLPPALRARHKLVATGWNDARQFGALRALAAECRLGDDEVLLLEHFIPEADLPGLYRASAVAVSPSLHEGFGLSAAEAMACGATAIGSNTTSLPEVIGHPDALFDPHDPTSIAAKLHAVLTDPGLRTTLSRHGQERARRYTWAETARRAWDALEGFAARAGARPPLGARKPRLACVLPFPPDGQAVPATLLWELARHYQMELFSEDMAPHDPRVAACFPVLPPGRIAEAAYDRVLYLLADDPGMAVLTIRLLPAFPGIVAVGSTPLSELLVRAPGTGGTTLLRDLLIEEQGWTAAIAASRDGAAMPGGLPPCDGALARRAVGVLVTAGQRHGWQDAPDLTVHQVPAAEREAAGHEWHDAIEASYARGVRASFAACLAGIAAEPFAGEALPAIATAAVASFRPPRGRRRTLLLDTSTIATFDAGTGIQRVVRETVRQLGLAEGLECRVEPVRQSDGRLSLARGFGMRLFGLPAPDTAFTPIEPGPADVYVALDLRLHDIDGLGRTLRHVRTQGGQAYAVVYDLLPMLAPELFPEPVQRAFPRWFDTIGRHADGLICISRTVAGEAAALLEQRRPSRTRPLKVGWFHLGADFLPAPDEVARPHENAAERRERPTLLMVGTIEPRKGHAEALDACDALWADGVEADLVIAGRPGWMTDKLVARLRTHPEAGRKLNWIEAATDEAVARLYRTTDALLMASTGEGFGLPLVEAARAGLPIIARDLPVFREVAGDSALYFGAGGARDLPAVLRCWLALHGEGRMPDPSGIETMSWAESSRQLAQVALGTSWYSSWGPALERS